MATDLKRMQEIFAEELAKVRDSRALERIRELAVAPVQVRRVWDYGAPGSYLCWTVLEHQQSSTAFVYCEDGFGPRCPWGLVSIDATTSSMGMDSSWFPSLEAALKDSFAWEDGV